MSSWWFVFILWWFLSGAFLEPFNQAHTFWYCPDYLIELSQAHRLPYHHFSGAHVRSLICPYWVILKSLRRTRCTSCCIGAYFPRLPTWQEALVAILGIFPFFVMEMIVFSWSCYHFLYSAERYLFALLVTVSMIYVEMSLLRSLTFGFWLSHYLWLFSRSLCWGSNNGPSGTFFLRSTSGSFLWDNDRFL